MIFQYENKIKERTKIKGFSICKCNGVINYESLKTSKDKYYFGKCSKCEQEFLAGSFEDLIIKIKNFNHLDIESDIEESKKRMLNIIEDELERALGRGDIADRRGLDRILDNLKKLINNK